MRNCSPRSFPFLLASALLLLVAVPSFVFAQDESSAVSPDRSTPTTLVESYARWQFAHQTDTVVPWMKQATKNRADYRATGAAVRLGDDKKEWREHQERIEDVLDQFDAAEKILEDRQAEVTDVTRFDSMDEFEAKSGVDLPDDASFSAFARIELRYDALDWDGEWSTREKSTTFHAVKLDDGWKLAGIEFTSKSGADLGLEEVNNLDNFLLPAPVESDIDDAKAESLARTVARRQFQRRRFPKLYGLEFGLQEGSKPAEQLDAWAYRPSIELFGPAPSDEDVLSREEFFAYLVREIDTLAEIETEIVGKDGNGDGTVEIAVEVRYRQEPSYRSLDEPESTEAIEFERKTRTVRVTCKKADGGWRVVSTEL